MIYLLDGTETYKLAEKKNKLLAADDLLKENIMTLDASSKTSFNLQNALLQCSTVSLFSEHRAVVLDDPYFLNSKNSSADTAGKSSKKNKEREQAVEILQKYCDSPSDSTDLIFYCFGFDADKRTKEFKVLDSHNGHSVIHLHFGSMSLQQLESLVDQTLQREHYHLTREARSELLLRISGQATDFYKAMDKLNLYGEKNLTLEDIEHLVPLSTNVNIFKFADSFVREDAAGCLRSLKEMTEIEGLPYINIISLLAARLRTQYNVLRLVECGVRNDEVSRRTGRKWLERDISDAHGKSSRVFLRWLAELADLDQGIKQGRINDREGFEAFLLRNL